MGNLQILLFALVLDYVVGDPQKLWRKLPHPAVLMGKMVSLFDAHLNNGSVLKIKGIASTILLSFSAIFIGWFIKWLPDFNILELISVTILLAHNSLIKHVKDVSDSLNQSLSAGRKAVACIVGRETKDLDESNVSRAAVESAAENFSDAVIAPAFWYIIFGLPGLILYKMTNTADSMVGYRTEKYLQYGFGAAKLDDLLNLIPSRICGILMCIVYRSQHSFGIMIKDAKLHSSPNAGWPESAMAALLNVALSGPRIYNGKLTNDPFLNSAGRHNMTSNDIKEAIMVLNRSWFAFTFFIATLVFFTWIF